MPSPSPSYKNLPRLSLCGGCLWFRKYPCRRESREWNGVKRLATINGITTRRTITFDRCGRGSKPKTYFLHTSEAYLSTNSFSWENILTHERSGREPTSCATGNFKIVRFDVRFDGGK